ncbi:glycosyltransferase [Aeromonas media]|nr:glycosyltransferase [Aeromonas media]
MVNDTLVDTSISIVTVAVITYHSAKTVVETLDSIVAQSYGPENIELIISDDGSRDNTVPVINEWLALHQAKFYCVKFFTNVANSGISKNCNVAWKAATSSWIKTIAGDDILLPNCLTDNIDFVFSQKHNDVSVLFSKMQLFSVAESGIRQELRILPTIHAQKFFKLSALKQFQYLQQQGISGAPSAFINRVKLASVGFADERFPMMEDHPLWFKLCQAGFKLNFMDKITVLYRIADSVSNSKSRLINVDYINEIVAVEEKLVIPTLSDNQYILKLRKRQWPKLAIRVAAIFDNKVTFFSKLAIAMIFMIKPGFLSAQLYKGFK